MCPKSSSKCPVEQELEPLIKALRERYSELTDDSCQRKVFLKRLRNLTRFGVEPIDYPVPEGITLPREIEVALAVCHPECGNQAYVVIEGGPQSCDGCGGTMMPTESATYRIKRR